MISFWKNIFRIFWWSETVALVPTSFSIYEYNFIRCLHQEISIKLGFSSFEVLFLHCVTYSMQSMEYVHRTSLHHLVTITSSKCYQFLLLFDSFRSYIIYFWTLLYSGKRYVINEWKGTKVMNNWVISVKSEIQLVNLIQLRVATHSD